jgi:hypothetical protein
MKLSTITGSLLTEGASITLFKGITATAGLNNWPAHEVGTTGKITPGFLSDFEIAMVYSDSGLVGEPPSMIAEFQIDPSQVEDRTTQFKEWCEQPDEDGDPRNQDYDISMDYPQEWRKDGSIWTVDDSGSGHAGVSCFNNSSFVYCGVPIPYVVKHFFATEEEYDAFEKTLRT